MLTINRLHVLRAIAFSVIFLPFLPTAGGLPLLRPEWFIVAAAAAAFPRAGTIDRVTVWFLILAGMIILSIFYGMAFHGTTVAARDGFELLKPVLYLMFYSFIRRIDLPVPELRRMVRAILCMLGVVALIAVVQYLDPGQTLKPFLSLYTDADRVDIYTGLRATATMSNPNDLGMLLVFGYSLCLFSMNQGILRPKAEMALLGLLAFGVFTSGSRTSMGAALAVTAYFLAKNLGFSLRKLRVIAAILVIFAIGTALVMRSEVFAKSVQRVLVFSDNEAAQVSWLLRVGAVIQTLELIGESPVLGWGPNKLGFELGDNVDNEYILILYRYGGAGLAVFAATLIALWRKARWPRIGGEPFLENYGNFLTGCLIGCAIFAYAAGVFHTFRLMTLLILFMSMGVAARNRAFPVRAAVPGYLEAGR